MSLGKQLKKARESSRMDLRQLAAKAGLEEWEVLRLEEEAGNVRDLVKLVTSLCCRLEVVPDAVLRIMDDIIEGE